MLRREVMKFVDREPVAAVSLAIGTFGLSLPLVVPPIREALGYPIKQVLTFIVYLIFSVASCCNAVER